MKVFRRAAEIKNQLDFLRKEGKTIGFVATMGALHDGHISLLRQANNDCDCSLTSIFVNPTQFNEQTDFDQYPRHESGDLKALEEAGCDLAFVPQTEEIYFGGKLKKIDYYDPLYDYLEGEWRPGHFHGVVTVVMRFFDILHPDKAYFGLKDFQQFMLIKRAAAKFHPNTEVIGVETVRDKYGLALSSRNERLSKEGLLNARALSQALRAFDEGKGSRGIDEIRTEGLERMRKAGFQPEYLELCEMKSLQTVEDWDTQKPLIALGAGKMEGVRLIDNWILKSP